MNITRNSIVGKVVAMDYHTASVFKSHNVDFCCKGGRSIEEVCQDKRLDIDMLLKELNRATFEEKSPGHDFQSWSMDLLIDYIEKKHHRYVREKLPELAGYLNKVARVHGTRHPELIEIELLFNASGQDLLSHMNKEEKILFPYVRNIVRAVSEQQELPMAPFGSVKNPIHMMMDEHDNEGERFRTIARLSNQYTPPDDACTTYRVAFSMLREFEEDLHMHIHLENNILFPKAMESEKELSCA